MERGSYLLIEPGMSVTGLDGSIGNVAEVVADADVDVFRGIVVSYGLLAAKRVMIGADDIIGVDEREVSVNIHKADVDHMPTVAA